MKIAIMGFGVVGSGVGELLLTNKSGVAKKAGEEIQVKYILDLRDFPDSPYKCFTKDFNDILNDSEIEVVVEAMGGTVPAYEFTKKLLLAGKHVVSSNKELVAKHGTELLQLAKEGNINYLFEASVGGGIPIIRPLISSLTGNDITGIVGILNGTTNYILTQMIKNGKSFEAALSEAQEKGYAEKDPTADVMGYDTCRKIAILASLAYGKYVDSTKIPTEGITNITAEDTKYAQELGYSVKLVGQCVKAENGIYARVCPAFISDESPLYNISDVFNGILVQGNSLGDVMFYGKGAGKLPTASAMVSDLVDVAKHKSTNIRILWAKSEEGYLLDGNEQKYSYYLRLTGDTAGFEDYKTARLTENEFALLTPPKTEEELEAMLKTKPFDGRKVLGKIRVI